MKTENNLHDKKTELLKLISDWAEGEKILQPDEILEVDLRVVKKKVVLQIGDQRDLMTIRAMSVSSMNGLSIRACNILNNGNITTVGQLADHSYYGMMRYRNCGRIAVQEFAASLLTLGIKVDWIEKGKKYHWNTYNVPKEDQ